MPYNYTTMLIGQKFSGCNVGQGGNRDANWHRNSFSSFGSSPWGGFGLQNAVWSLVFELWAGFAAHPIEGLPC